MAMSKEVGELVERLQMKAHAARGDAEVIRKTISALSSASGRDLMVLSDLEQKCRNDASTFTDAAQMLRELASRQEAGTDAAP